ncbi:MAG: phage tail sheath protein [Bryobacterales bacterium]|nr:phage tail sheath protein [Bryobacterales bacterium]
MQYFMNGGRNAYAVRVAPSTAATASLDPGGAVSRRLLIRAASPGSWGNCVRVVAIRPELYNAASPTFTLSVQEIGAGAKVVRNEAFAALSIDPAHPEYFVKGVNSQSELVELADAGAAFPMPALVPHNSPELVSGAAYNNLAGGADGAWNAATGEYATALRSAVSDATSPLSRLAPGLFNILCIPATATLDEKAAGPVMAQAQSYCEAKRAFLHRRHTWVEGDSFTTEYGGLVPDQSAIPDQRLGGGVLPKAPLA